MGKPTTTTTTTDTKPTGLLARFYTNETTNARAPLFRAEIELDGSLSGMVLEAAIYAERDARGSITGFRAAMPGSGRFGEPFRAKPVYVEATDGKAYPVKDSRCADGARIVDGWTPAIVDALHRFQKTGEPVQVVHI